MKTVVIILGVLVLIGGAYFLFKPSQEPERIREPTGPTTPMEPSKPTRPTVTHSEVDELTVEEDESLGPMPIDQRVMQNGNTLTAELVDVSGGSSSGTGYVLRENNTLYHYVTAELPAPQGTNQYEGWLVQQTPELVFFSTGVMELGDNGIYMLSYQSPVTNEGYDFVVITEETVVDETPGTHILEGTAR